MLGMHATRVKRKVYRVVLVFPYGITRSVFVRDKDRVRAEQHALKKYPSAVRVDYSPYPQN
jgi:hypothetical protein